MIDIQKLVRENIKALKPYSSARDEFKGEASVYLDANENGYGSPLSENYNRYPDPLQRELKRKISTLKGVPTNNIFLGNGSDEAIDVLFRIFCEPKTDNVIICPPTYGMYEVSANINDVEARKVTLLPSFQLDVEKILASSDEHSKLLFICSPNNPTGNSVNADDVELLIQKFSGIVVVDEAYINYSKQLSAIRFLTEYENVVVLQTFSKAWGLAGLRLGMAFASQRVMYYMNKVKPPYNVNQATQEIAMKAIDNIDWVTQHIHTTIHEREKLNSALNRFSFVEKTYPTDANFLLVKMKDAQSLYNHLVFLGVIVRDRSKVSLCEECLRITVGTALENDLLLDALNKFNA